MDEKSKDKRKRGVFSGREIFYFFFALMVFGVLVLVFTLEWSVWRYQAIQERNAKFANARRVASTIEYYGGAVISETQLLYGYGRPTTWRVYDIRTDEITDGSYLGRAPAQSIAYRAELTNWNHLSGYKGNLILTTRGLTNQESLIFQWRTNSDEPQVFKWAEFEEGDGRKSAPHVIAVENGWILGAAFYNFQNGDVRLIWVGNFNQPMPVTNIVLTNLNKLGTVNCEPFREALYITTAIPDTLHADIYIFSLVSRSLTFSNNTVKMPRAFDYMNAMPDPSGKLVLWTFGVKPKINTKLRSVLPEAIAPEEAPTTWYLYSSDLRATKFKFLCMIKGKQFWYGLPPQFLWGVNGDSIWLLDDDEGIKRVELK